MKVLITGISGFVGSGLARHLLKNQVTVHGIVRKNSNLWRLHGLEKELDLHNADLLDEQAVTKIVKEVKPDVIYHLAAYGAYPTKQTEIELILNTATKTTLNLLNAAKITGVSMFVSTGSSSEYGTKDHPMREDESIDPNSYYAIGKATQTYLGQYFAANEGVPTVTFRLFSVYGPYEEPGRLVPTIISNALNKQTINIADPKIARDFIFIDDVCQALFLGAQQKDLSGEIINLGTGSQYTLGDMADMVLSQCDNPTPYVVGGYDKRSFDTYTWVADTSKLKEKLNFTHTYSLEDGIRSTIEWYKNHAHLYETN